MSILEDQKELRVRNINFITNYAKKLLSSLFEINRVKYANLIEQNVLDKSNNKEVKKYLKKRFKTVETDFHYPCNPPYKLYKSINIDKHGYTFDLNELLNDAIKSQLVNSIYPLLETQIKEGITPHKFSVWTSNIKYTASKVYIKYLIKELLESPTPDYNTEYLYLFKSWGFELFEYLNDSFDSVTAETVKYTLIYHLLSDKMYIKGTIKGYREFVAPYLLTHVGFSRLDFRWSSDEKYLKHEQHLTSLYKRFKKTHNL